MSEFYYHARAKQEEFERRGAHARLVREVRANKQGLVPQPKRNLSLMPFLLRLIKLIRGIWQHNPPKASTIRRTTGHCESPMIGVDCKTAC